MFARLVVERDFIVGNRYRHEVKQTISQSHAENLFHFSSLRKDYSRTWAFTLNFELFLNCDYS